MRFGAMKKIKGKGARAGRSSLQSGQSQALQAQPTCMPLPEKVLCLSDSQGMKVSRRAEDDLICPISLELPFDPVTAEDGRVYEKSAIKEHIKSKSCGDQLRSPITNGPMGNRLLAAPQHKNIIETLIENKVIVGDLVTSWQARAVAKEENEMGALLTKAKQGNLSSMEWVAYYYYNDKHGFGKDLQQAYLWSERARIAGSVECMARVGAMLVFGRGVAKNETQGLIYITSAAERGSDFAAWQLGNALANGKFGLPIDLAEACSWFERSLRKECSHKHLSKNCKKRAQQNLDTWKQAPHLR